MAESETLGRVLCSISAPEFREIKAPVTIKNDLYRYCYIEATAQ